MQREWLSVADAAQELNVSRSTAWRYVQTGQLVSYRLGGRRKILKDDLDAFIAQGRGYRRVR